MLRINSSPLGLYYTSYEAFVSIAPYANFEDALRLFPINNRISASFKGGHNINRWNGVLQDCLIFAKFIKTYRNSFNNISIIIQDYIYVNFKMIFTQNKLKIIQKKHISKFFQ